MKALALLVGAMLATGCAVKLTGAACQTNDNCPSDQRCDPATKTCELATGTGDGGAGDGGGGGGDGGNPDGGVSQCPAVTGGPFYVDPTSGSATTATVPPTGAKDPAQCRFARITDALAAAGSVSPATILLVGDSLKPAWQALHVYASGATVTPVIPNGFYYTSGGGTSALSEPSSWPTKAGGTVKDGTVTWTNAGTATQQLFANETLPLAVPNRATVSSEACFLAGGQGCDARAYQLDCSTSANPIVHLGPRASLAGMTVSARTGSNMGGSALLVDAADAQLDSVILIGNAIGHGPGMAVGLEIADATAPARQANVTASRLVSMGFQTGVLMRSTSSTASVIAGAVLGSPDWRNANGLVMASGLLQCNKTFVIQSDAAGVVVDPGAGPGTPNLTLSEGNITNNGNAGAAGAPGLRLVSGTVTLNGEDLNSNGAEGLLIEGGSVTANAANASPCHFNSNGTKLPASGVHVRPEAHFGGAQSVAAFNAGVGMLVEGFADLTGVDVKNNTGAGVVVQSRNTVGFNGGNLHNNTGPGAEVHRANQLTLNNVTVNANGSNNGNAGVWLHGDSGDVNATVSGCSIHENGGPGIQVEEGPGNATSATLEGNDVYANGSSGTPKAGIRFATPSRLQSFLSNRVHSNSGPQVLFQDKPDNGNTWDLGQGDCGAGNGQNAFYCYSPVAGSLDNVGLKATSAGGTSYTVNAQKSSWKASIPAPGADYQADAAVTVDASSPCSANTTCP